MMMENKSKNMPGIINGQQMNAANNYFEEKFQGARGHGFAAERANDLYDKFTGKDARIIGDDNAKDGADRIVNGVNIQSKYCSSGSKCIQECFRDGQFRYYNLDGSPMQIEVPSDKYDDAIRAMQERINRGQIKGVKNAKDVIRKGSITYEQAKNITKFGTIDSLKYDAANGLVSGALSGSVSAAINFAVSSLNGKSFDEALDDAVGAGLQVAGTTFAVATIAGQAAKTSLNSALVGYSDEIVKSIGTEAATKLANAFRSGSNIYGAAAMKNASKLLRSNAITGAATVLVMSVGDISDIFNSKISGAQFVKNLANTAANVAGGTAGWMAGAAAGSVIPVVGTFLGGLAGAFVGSSIADKASKAVLDGLIVDDAKEMLQILEEEFKGVVFDYLLNENEANAVMDLVKSDLNDGSKLKDMFASNNHHRYARRWLESCADTVIKRRPKVYLPSNEDMVRGLKKVLEKNNNNIKNTTVGKIQKFCIGFGWDINNSSDSHNLEIDIMAFLVDKTGKTTNDKDFIFYNNLQHESKSVELMHTGIKFDLGKVPNYIQRIDFVITIYEAILRNQNFGQIKNLYMYIIDDETCTEVARRYDIGKYLKTETSLFIGNFCRYNRRWKFNLIDKGFSVEPKYIARSYGVNI